MIDSTTTLGSARVIVVDYRSIGASEKHLASVFLANTLMYQGTASLIFKKGKLLKTHMMHY